METMTIGKLAEAAGVTADTLRFYEREGLIAPAGRTAAGYRLYAPEAVRQVDFIKRAQSVGFTLAEARKLLEFREGGEASAKDVHDLANAKIEDFREKIEEMERMIETLDHLVEACPAHGPVSGCPILDFLYPHEKNHPAGGEEIAS